MAKLTDVHLRQMVKAGVKAAVAQGEVPGLTFTVSVKGTASWILRYRFDGAAREYTIGQYPEFSLAAAKAEALDLRMRIQKGIDVAREKQQAVAERAAAMSVQQLAADYMAKVFPRLAANTIKQRRYHIEKLILPKLGRLPARDITSDDVVALIEDVATPNVGKLALVALNEVFKHGVARRAVKTNPCNGLSAAAIRGRAEPRQRLNLNVDELRAILPALPEIGAVNALAIKILLATCTRIGELVQAEWGDVDFDKGAWRIPDENSKTRSGFTVPLAPAVAGWFKELHSLAGESRFVLPARRGGGTHMKQQTLNAALHRLCDELPKVRRFTPHDLRSTARSHLAELGTDVIVAERCLNHTLGGVLSIYNVHDYLSERRVALERWTAYLLTCEAGEAWNVTPIAHRVA